MVFSGKSVVTNDLMKAKTFPRCEHVCHEDEGHDSFMFLSDLPTFGIPELLLQTESMFPLAILHCLSPFTLSNSYSELNAKPLSLETKIPTQKRSMPFDTTVTFIHPEHRKTVSVNRMFSTTSTGSKSNISPISLVGHTAILSSQMFSASTTCSETTFFRIPAMGCKIILSDLMVSAAKTGMVTRSRSKSASRQQQQIPFMPRQIADPNTSRARGVSQSGAGFLHVTKIVVPQGFRCNLLSLSYGPGLKNLTKTAVPQELRSNLSSSNTQAVRAGQTSSNRVLQAERVGLTSSDDVLQALQSSIQSVLQAVHSLTPSCCFSAAVIRRTMTIVMMYYRSQAARASAANRVTYVQLLDRLKEALDRTCLEWFAAQFEVAFTLKNERHSAYKVSLLGKVIESRTIKYESIPLGNFSRFICNQLLLEAIESDKTLHILDVHVECGLQWSEFFLLLAEQMSKPPKVRLSILGSNPAEMAKFGAYLNKCAKDLSLSFEFCPILTPSESFFNNIGKIPVDMYPDEVFVISSCAQLRGLFHEESNDFDRLLKDLKQFKPKVMVLAENDGELNPNIFSERLVECMHYCSATCTLSKAWASPDSPALVKKEHSDGLRRIQESILGKRRASVEGFENMTCWYKRMEAARFRCIPLSVNTISNAIDLVRPHYVRGFTLKNEEYGYLTLGWNGAPLISVSAWS